MLVNLLFIFAALLSDNTVRGHKCFVCRRDGETPEDSLQMRRDFPNVKISLCSEYKQSLKESFLMECPANSGGCLTKFEDDGTVQRTCARIGIDDCKKANAVNYCYCSKEACNTPDRRLAEAGWAATEPRRGHDLKTTAGGLPPVDDEDLAGEGSGEEDWHGFYYDSYYDTGDLEPGFGGPEDYAVDVTETPDFIAHELEKEYEGIMRVHNEEKERHKEHQQGQRDHHKNHRDQHHRPGHKYDRDNGIVFVEETIVVGGGEETGGQGSAAPHLAPVLALVLASCLLSSSRHQLSQLLGGAAAALLYYSCSS